MGKDSEVRFLHVHRFGEPVADNFRWSIGMQRFAYEAYRCRVVR